MRITEVAVFLMLSHLAGASLGAVAKLGLGYDIATKAPGSSDFTSE
jgi:hypothetical protein